MVGGLPEKRYRPRNEERGEGLSMLDRRPRRGALIGTLLLAMAVTAAPGPSQADRLSTSNRAALFQSQTRVLDSRAASQYANSVRLQPPRVDVPAAYGGPAWGGRYSGPYLDMARSAARRHAIPEDLFLRLVQQESGWNARAKSRAGAQGLAQLMPGTAALLGVADVWDPFQNLDGGARYLRMMYEEFGTWRLALAAYNAGPEAVRRHDGVPPFRETRDYVRIIWGN